MRRLLLLAALLVSRNASANQCPALQQFVATPQLPAGCPLVVYQDHEYHQGQMIELYLDHAGTSTKLTPAGMTSSLEELSVYYETIDENCIEHYGYQSRIWDRIEIDLGAAPQPGDRVALLGGYPDATITAAGPCPTTAPPENLYCQDPVQDWWACQHGDDFPTPDGGIDEGGGGGGYFGGGCNAGSSLGFAGIALLAGLRRRRRADAATTQG